MKPSFNVLDRNQKIHQNYLLEASAGTGKTFSIENVVVRLMLEEPTLALEQILVVTFTRAATRDLKIRIRANIEKALAILQGKTEKAPADYLFALIEQGDEAIGKASKRLEQALFCFDQAQIFTIHGFCGRMLRNYLFEGDLGLSAQISEDANLNNLMLRIIRDFIRTELHSEAYSSAQLSLLLKEYSMEQLEKSILRTAAKGLEFEQLPNFASSFKAFKSALTRLQKLNFQAEKIIEDFIQCAPSYKNICNQQKEVKSECLEKVTRLANLLEKPQVEAKDFDKILLDDLFVVTAFDAENLKANKKAPTPIHYPNFLDLLRTELMPIIQQARNSIAIFSRVASGCQQLLQKYLSEEELLSSNDLLSTMVSGLKNPLFVSRIRKTYSAAIIDEFQDTDPIQWEIFQELFLNAGSDWGHLYLVGDPKQSIYAFRQADIYTYLAAAEGLGVENHAALDTNYRSQPSLVHALNALFSTESVPGFISLPRINKFLPYFPVQTSPNAHVKSFSDNIGSVHFCLVESSENNTNKALEKAEESQFFPFIAEEIRRLNSLDNIPLKQCAVLVADRFQASRLAEFLQKNQIDAVSQRAGSLIDSRALPAIRELLQAVLHPKNENAVKTALGNPIIGWTLDSIRSLNDQVQLEHVLAKFQILRRELFENGFASFFHSVMQSSWHPSQQTISERLLSLASGLDLYDDLHQISHLIMEKENCNQTNPENFVTFLDNLELSELSDDAQLKKSRDLTKDAVNILTIHASKGLEYEVVFALGLIKRSYSPEKLFPIGNRLHYVADANSEFYHQYCKELDAEKMRQLYVAMTRAKYRLYLPVLFYPNAKVPEPGCASSLELFLTRLGQPELSMDRVYAQLANINAKKLSFFLDNIKTTTGITYSQPENSPSHNSTGFVKASSPILVSPSIVQIPGKIQHISSFTQLSKNLPKQETYLTDPPHLFHAHNKNAHTLPSGSETGTILHTILEKIPYSAVRNASDPAALLHLVLPFIRHTPFEEWALVICQIVFQAFHVALGREGFCIGDIPEENRFQENEFLYPTTGVEDLVHLEGFEQTSGFLKGVIDMIFQHEGKYYLLDWKSNWLGPDLTHYNLKNLEEAMNDHHYFLQATIYIEAFKRYLALFDTLPFTEIFGGVFYIFLRGLDFSGSNQTGVYYFNPNK